MDQIRRHSSGRPFREALIKQRTGDKSGCAHRETQLVGDNSPCLVWRERTGSVLRLSRALSAAIVRTEPARGLLLLALGATMQLAAQPSKPDLSRVPGVVINHLPATSGLYIGSPGLAMLPNGDYVASHDHFGPKSTEHQQAQTAVFRSSDQGEHWERISTVEGQFWSTLFTHGRPPDARALYLMGTDAHPGHAIIRRSIDGGVTWTAPKGSSVAPSSAP